MEYNLISEYEIKKTTKSYLIGLSNVYEFENKARPFKHKILLHTYSGYPYVDRNAPEENKKY